MYKRKSRIILLILTLFSLLFPVSSLAANVLYDEDILNELYEIVLEGENRIYLDLKGTRIFFDESLENIYISDELEYDRRGGRLNIYYPRKSIYELFDNDHLIVVGTKNPFRIIDIDAGGISLAGNLTADEMKINAGGINMHGEYHVDEMRINGAGIDIRGSFDTEYVRINGAGVSLDLDIASLQNININGVGIDADLKYTDIWTGTREVSVNGIGGNVNIMLRKDNIDENGNIKLNKNGIIGTEVNYY